MSAVVQPQVYRSLEKRYYTALAILVAAAVFTVFYLFPSKSAPQVKYAERLPMEVDGWIGKDLEVDEQTKIILETDDVLMRGYRRGAEPPVVLAVVFAQENRKVAHPPEVCLRGSGFEMEGKGVSHLRDDFPVMRLVTVRGDDRELYYYWYKSGDLFTENYIKQQLYIAWGHLTRKGASASLIRLSTSVDDRDFEAASQRLKDFGNAILPAIKRELP
jgi:EpsI family protein